jgi:hypothetical protein
LNSRRSSEEAARGHDGEADPHQERAEGRREADLSEAWLRREGHDGSDLVQTRQRIGARRGVLHPRSPLLLSPRLYRLLRELKVGRLVVEVAHLTR